MTCIKFVRNKLLPVCLADNCGQISYMGASLSPRSHKHQAIIPVIIQDSGLQSHFFSPCLLISCCLIKSGWERGCSTADLKKDGSPTLPLLRPQGSPQQCIKMPNHGDQRKKSKAPPLCRTHDSTTDWQGNTDSLFHRGSQSSFWSSSIFIKKVSSLKKKKKKVANLQDDNGNSQCITRKVQVSSLKKMNCGNNNSLLGCFLTRPSFLSTSPFNKVISKDKNRTCR